MRQVFGHLLNENGKPTWLRGRVLFVKWIPNSGLIAYCESDSHSTKRMYMIFDLASPVEGEFVVAFDDRNTGAVKMLYRMVDNEAT